VNRSLALPALAGLALLVGCAHAPLDRSRAPAPLVTPDFVPPSPSEATLSSGLRVVLVENHETPLVHARLVFRDGSWTDPAGREGLAAVTMDMLDEGVDGLDAEGLARALQRLGSGLGASAGEDGATVAFSTLARNLDPTLDLVRRVLVTPTFPDADWARMRTRRLAGLAKARKDPEAIAARVVDRVLLGDAYRGRLVTEGSLAAIDPAAMRAWWAEHGRADRAVLFVGGDTTLPDLLPRLERALGAWTPPPVSAGPTAPADRPLPVTPAIHLVDRPGAPQSVLRVTGYVTAPTAPDWDALVLANQVVGGPFTARLNMNLREDKGWTYGARGGFSFDHAGGRYTVSTGVRADVTVPALGEILRELRDPAGPRPLTAQEFEDGRAALLFGRPLQFENPDWRLGQEENRWRYALPDGWVVGYVPRVRAVPLPDAQAAWTRVVAAAPLAVVVVGDATSLRTPLAALGLPIVERDVDGNPLPPAVTPAKE
jgi:zinc protease